MRQDKPAFCIISQNGGLYSIQNYAKGKSTSSTSGYSAQQVFSDLPPDTPVVDWRKASMPDVMTHAIRTELPECVSPSLFGNEKPVTMKVYFEGCVQAGATITTVQEILAEA